MYCSDCGIPFSLVKEHRNLDHLNEKEYRCMFCGQLFDTLHLMFDHVVEHDGSTFCYFCNEPCDNYESLMDHVDIHPELHVYCCKQCHWTSANKVKFLDHTCAINENVSEHDSGVESIVPTKKRSRFGRIQRKNNHGFPKIALKPSYHNISSRRKDPATLKFIASCQMSDGYYYCPDCPKQLKTSRGFKYHLFRHKNLLNYECEMCSSRFPNNNKLQVHIRQTHMVQSKVYACHLCNNKYKSEVSLKYHLVQHRGGFICSHCSTSYSGKHLLKNHIIIRECCEKIFMCRTLYDEHVIQSEHYLPCQYCSSRFNSEWILKQHISKEHRSEVATHECNECGLLIKGSHNYARHKRRRHLNPKVNQKRKKS